MPVSFSVHVLYFAGIFYLTRGLQAPVLIFMLLCGGGLRGWLRVRCPIPAIAATAVAAIAGFWLFLYLFSMKKAGRP